MERSLCWKHLSGCFISRIFSAPCFLLQLPYAFSPTLSCVQAPTHTHFMTSSHPECRWYAVPLLCWVKVQSFSAPPQSSSHKTCICWSYLLCMTCSLFTLLCLFLSWTHPVVPFPTCVCQECSLSHSSPGWQMGWRKDEWSKEPEGLLLPVP